MGLWAYITGSSNPVVDMATQAVPGPNREGANFAVDETSMPPTVVGLVSYSDALAAAPRVERRAAMQVPAVKRCRDLVAGTLGTLPVDLYGPDKKPSTFSTLLAQPERDVPRSVTMARTFEDLLFEKVAWWRVTEFYANGFPSFVARLDPRSVSITEDSRVWYSKDGNPQGTSGEWLTDAELIRFDSPNDALLIAGARAIRTCLALDAAVANMADGVPPLDYFTPAEGADPAEDEDIVEILDAWKAARQARSTGYVPAALKYNANGWTPEQLQLADARQHAVLEIARTAGVEPEDVGVSVTSRTYFNSFDRKQHFIQSTLAGYIAAVEDRLSMGDVNPRGYTARINVAGLLRSDDLARFQAYQLGLQVGAITPEQIAAAEGNPTVNQPQQPAPPALPAPGQAPQLHAVQNFDSNEVTTFDAPVAPETFSVNREARTIKGLAMPYGTISQDGRTFSFTKGSIQFGDPGRIKLLVAHNWDRAIGKAVALDDTDTGLMATFKVARGAAGDEALSMAEDGVWDGLSVGLGKGMKTQLKDGVQHVVSSSLREISQTPCPAYDGARITEVAASAQNQENQMKCTKCNVVHADGVTECKAEDVTKFEAEKGGGTDFSAIGDAIANGLKTGFEGLQFPQREVVSATGGGAHFEVKEPSPYRFDGLEGEHGFLEDIRAAHFSNDGEAKGRVDKFMDEVFAVTSSNVAALNPTQNRPDLFVPNLQFTRPLWELCSTGVVTDKTPFTIPKFSSASGLVNAHTEGVEPTPGAYAATSQTVTPTPVSGKVEIVREVWDQGGSPKADAMVWAEMLNAYFEAIETKIATLLNGLSLTETGFASAVDATLVNGVTNMLVDLQFVRGGNRYSALALDGNFFKALVNAADSAGRKLLPVIGPANASGTVEPGFDRIQIGSLTGRAAWALGATNASNSYLFVPTSVWAWASAPKKFEFEYRVSAIDLAIWGYTAAASLRDSDVKRLDYTTADS